MSSARAGSGPPDEVLLGVDVGTTAAKVVAFGVGRPWRYTAVREYPLLQPEPGWRVQDLSSVLQGLLDALTECVRATGGARVAGLSLSAAAHGLIGLDAGLHPVTPLLTWADARSGRQARALRDSGRARALHQRSGTPVHPMTPLTKLMWFADAEPALASQVRWWVGLKDYLLHALTGTLATEFSSASATGLLDIRNREWDPEALALAGVAADRLPPVLPTTATLPLLESVGTRVGLPASVPVVVGAADGPLANLGVGALEPGVVGLSIGTSGAARMTLDSPVTDPDGRLFCYALTEQRWVVGGAVSNGGAVARWARSVFAPSSEAEPGDRDTELLALAESAPPGSDGLVMLPYLIAERAPLWDPDVTGAYLGLRREHTRAHFVRAAVEGVALQLSILVELLDRVHPVTQVRATGGVFRSRLWRRVVASALGRPLVVTAGAEGTALGAAALGAVALGRSADLQSALELLDSGSGGDEVEPVDPADVAVYAGLRASVPGLLTSYEQVAQLLATTGPEPGGAALPQPAREATRSNPLGAHALGSSTADEAPTTAVPSPTQE